MIRPLPAIAILLLGCSGSSSEPAAPACQIAGTYTMTGQIETNSPGCTDVPDAGANVAPSEIAVTISARPPGKTGPDFFVELQGATGGCYADLSGTCKVQAKCDLQVLDAIDPNNSTATLQISWTFDASGFKGTNSMLTPPARSLPSGCSYTANVTGIRR